MMSEMRCTVVQECLSAALVARTDLRDVLAAEAHAARCLRCAETVRDLAAVSVALDRAYAPLRSRGVALSPARVHLALRTPARPQTQGRVLGVMGRLSEVAVAAAVMVFAMVGTLPQPSVERVVDAEVNAGPIRLTQGIVDAPAEPSVSFRIGRYLLHDTLLDARVVPVERPHLEGAAPMLIGQPY